MDETSQVDPKRRELMTAAGSTGLIFVFLGLFMLPPPADSSWIIAIAFAVLIAFLISVAAGRAYRLMETPPTLGFKAYLLSPPVATFAVLLVVLCALRLAISHL